MKLTTADNKLPWWTWVIPLLVFYLGSLISLKFRFTQGVGAFSCQQLSQLS